MKKEGGNKGASVRARLLNLAQKNGQDFQLVLLRHVNERMLYRLSRSEHAHQFILKGASLFAAWTGDLHRATRDVDFLGRGNAKEESIRSSFLTILSTEVENDGVLFDTTSLEVGPIREEQQYGGMRIKLNAFIDTARIRCQIDVGFGDTITPNIVEIDYPTLLDFAAPLLKAYPQETVVAEKIEAIVHLSLENTRMKDFYDLVVIARLFEFDGAI